MRTFKERDHQRQKVRASLPTLQPANLDGSTQLYSTLLNSILTNSARHYRVGVARLDQLGGTYHQPITHKQKGEEGGNFLCCEPPGRSDSAGCRALCVSWLSCTAATTWQQPTTRAACPFGTARRDPSPHRPVRMHVTVNCRGLAVNSLPTRCQLAVNSLHAHDLMIPWSSAPF